MIALPIQEPQRWTCE